MKQIEKLVYAFIGLFISMMGFLTVIEILFTSSILYTIQCFLIILSLAYLEWSEEEVSKNV